MRKILFIFFGLFSFVLKSQVTSGLVLHLDARDTNSYSGSGNTWNDLSGNNYNATINGATFNSNGKYFYFDGSNDYVNTNKTASQFGIYNANYTMEAVFRVPNTGRGDNMVFGTNQTSTGRGLHNGTRNSTFYFGHYSQDIASGNIVSTNTWYHVTWTYSGSTMRIYRNASQVASGNKSRFIGTTNIWIGRHWRWFMGDIVYVKIYNRALSSQEITTNYNHYANPNSAPTDISLSASAFNENIPTGTHVASLTATDSDNGDSHTFTLASGNGTNDADNNHFTIQGASLKTSGTFDYETKSSYNIYINTNDGTANYAKAFTLTVNDIDDIPDNINFGPTFTEDGLIVNQMDARNSNSYSGSGNTWSDLSGNGNHFTIQGQMPHNSTDGFTFQSGQTSNYPYINNFQHPTSAFTDELYIKTSQAGDVGIKSYAVGGSDNNALIFKTNPIRLYGPSSYIQTTVNIADGQYHHLVRTSNRSNGQEKIYLDGTLVWSGTHLAASNATAGGTIMLARTRFSRRITRC